VGNALGGFDRDSYFLATKVYFPMGEGPNDRGLSRKHITEQCHASLRRLGTDYVDLYQIHRHDPYTPYEETMEALHDVVRAGKARYLGASSMWAWQFAKYQQAAREHGWTPFVSMQDELSLVYREEEREMLPLCRADGIGVIPWSPLGGGKLTRPWGERTDRSTTDRYNKSMYDEDAPDEQAVVQAVADLAQARGVSMAQVALAWVMRQPGVTAPIVGASKMRHVEDALAAAALVLSDEEAARLEGPYRPHVPRGFS
jgi:aryl-alcohol dehydrogenase-like predicted oxidoreductase